jgi:hypothetical protein
MSVNDLEQPISQDYPAFEWLTYSPARTLLRGQGQARAPTILSDAIVGYRRAARAEGGNGKVRCLTYPKPTACPADRNAAIMAVS